VIVLDSTFLLVALQTLDRFLVREGWKYKRFRFHKPKKMVNFKVFKTFGCQKSEIKRIFGGRKG
jgi:hypothetical protein